VKRAGNGNGFFGCSKYPKCTATRPFPTEFRCPLPGCDGHLVERRTQRGGFLGCSNFPKCHFGTTASPEKDPCPTCHSPFRLRKRAKGGEEGALYCPNPECPSHPPEEEDKISPSTRGRGSWSKSSASKPGPKPGAKRGPKAAPKARKAPATRPRAARTDGKAGPGS
jgi:DNA topoisomerase-1